MNGERLGDLGDLYGHFPADLSEEERWEMIFLLLWVWGCAVEGLSTVGPYMAWARGDVQLPGLLGMN